MFWIAALATAIATPAGLAFAAEGPNSPPPQTGLRAPLAGHPSVGGEIREHLRGEYDRLARRIAGAVSSRLSPRRSARMSTVELRRAIPILRAIVHKQGRRSAVPPILERIARCESGGDPRRIGGGGMYRGKYQFSVATWHAVGGRGDPAAAPEAEQDRRAKLLLERSGPSQWPVCSGG
jgi:hypothetical protein